MSAAPHAERLESIAAELATDWPSIVDRTGRLLLAAAARVSALTEIELLHATDRRAVRARWLVAIVGRDQLRQSWNDIAELLHRDHSTVIHGARRGRALAGTDPDFSAALVWLRDRFDGLGRREIAL